MAESQASALNGADILVVDDTPANLLAFEVALGDLAGKVVRSNSGAEALRLLLEKDFALVILDVQMPGMDGFETARLIRERRRSRHTPIIFVTAHTREDRDLREAYALGAVDFLQKPFQPEVLRAKAGVFVALQQRTAEVAQQALRLREHERREHERRMAEELQRWQQAALRKQMAELAEADRRKDEFLAMLSHELRNPLAPILTGLQFLRRKFPEHDGLDPSILRARDTVERQVRHLIRLVDDLLDISRITSGKIELRRGPVALAEVVEQAVSSVEPLIDARSHTLTVGLPDQKLTLNADAVRLTQVLANLLTNAARYTDPGGTIRLGCKRSDDMLEIRVTDNGRGIAPDLLPRVFDMFVQEHDADAGGLGLGLALVKRLIEMHEGTVAVHSDGPARGSEFVVCLPVPPQAPPGAPGADPPQGDGNAQGSGPRALSIVVVEDNDDLRETVAMLLNLLGHSVDLAANGEEGAELIIARSPDVALVDIGLPRLDGHGVARRVRERQRGKRSYLIAMSGFGQEADRKRAAEAGFDAHLVKPADAESLERVLGSIPIATP